MVCWFRETIMILEKMIRVVFFIFMIGFFCACTWFKPKHSEASTSGCTGEMMYVCDLWPVVGGRCADTATLNSIARQIRFIRLENTPQSLLTNLNLIIDEVEGKFMASSFGSGVMQFDSLGNYEKKVIDIGRAKNEVQNRLYQWVYQNDQIALCQGHKMITYTPSTGIARGYLSNQHYCNVVFLKNGEYVALPNLGPEMKGGRYLDFLDQEYKVVQSLSDTSGREIYYRLPISYTGPLETYGLYSSYTGDALFKDMFNDTIYKVKDASTIVPYICLKRGDRVPTVKNVVDEGYFNDRVFIQNVGESEDYVFVKYGYSESVFSAVFSKTSGENVMNTGIGLKESNSLINSMYFMDYITPKGKKIKVGISVIKGDRLFCVVRTVDALEFMPQMNEYDNPLILEVMLK